MTDLSIIVTFYNEYAFVDEAIHSILGQGLESFEILLVNDNPDIYAREWLEQKFAKERVTLINHERNMGLSGARNTGIANAKGKYITFLDADDYFLIKGLCAHLELALQTDADLVHAPFVAVREETTGPDSSFTPNRVDVTWFNSSSLGSSVEETPQLQLIVAPWKFLHKRAFMIKNQLLFDPELRKFEDRPFMLANITSGGRFAFHPLPTRAWRKRPGSITATDKSDKDLCDMCISTSKCFEIITAYTDAEGRRENMVQREVVHMLVRAIAGTSLLAAALSTRSCAPTVRSTLQKFAALSPPNPETLKDPIVNFLVANVKRRFSGTGFTNKDFLGLWHLISCGEWAELQGLPLVGRLYPTDETSKNTLA